MTRTWSSAAACSMVCRTSASIVRVHALSLSGRFSVIVATRPETVYWIS